MKPYTTEYQKVMLPLHGKPLLEYIVDGLKHAGIDEFIFVVGYLKDQIIDHFENGKEFGISIEYVEQEDLNGTGGAVLLCEELIENNHFFLTWGDILVPYKIYKQVYDVFQTEDIHYILVTNYQENLQKGCAVICDGNYCINMIEKPQTYDTNLNNCGIFILKTEIFDVLKSIPTSNRGELELTDALATGIKEREWKVRLIKMNKGEFRGDFGDPHIYNRLKSDETWLKNL
jgi:NDP-sugar pyrophosphorylase family protein